MWEFGMPHGGFGDPDHRLRTGMVLTGDPSLPSSVVRRAAVAWRWNCFAHCLQEIKKKKGIKEEVQLTSKQKEMLQAQLDKEAQIRRRLQEVRILGSPSPLLTVPEQGPADLPPGGTVLAAGQ